MKIIENKKNMKATLNMVNEWWREPESVCKEFWEARVALLYKKGDTSKFENYRPISLLPLCYKVFAQALLTRLKDGGTDDFILWETQFGFRRGRGTVDALFLARRSLEESRGCEGWQACDVSTGLGEGV